MLDQHAAMVSIELAERDKPRCTCGAPTSPIGRDGDVWLECITLRDQRNDGRVARFIRLLTEPAHVSEPIFEVEKAA
jgi:hypothetical protein